MPWKGPDDRTDFPTLGLLIDRWVARHCVVPDGFKLGRPFVFSPQQYTFQAHHYRLKIDAQPAWLWAEDDDEEVERELAFVYRRSQLVRAQKWGKNPMIAAQICVEGVGPALFAGWAGNDDGWACADHGCRCGWEMPYEPGDPMGMLWPTPLIQITATSEDQTDNTYDALRPMIDNGRLSDLIPKTGEEFIRLPGNGRIDVVTSNARSRLGQRVTFCPQDETGLWTATTGMIEVARVQRRGLAGMGGRAVETTNPWDPAENSIGQQTYQSRVADVHRDYRKPPSGLSYTNKAERRRIHRFNYEGCPWITLDGIEGEAAEVLEVDPAQAERFFGNRIMAGKGNAFDSDRWGKLLPNPPHIVADQTLITLGVCGGRYADALAIVATDIAAGFQWPLGIWERPPAAADDYEHPADEIDGAMTEAMDRFEVWRCYVNPAQIEYLYDRWAGRWDKDRKTADKRFLPWETNRPKQMAYALRAYRSAQTAGDLHHDGDSEMARHIANARKRATTVKDDDGKPMWLIQKESDALQIAGALAGCLSWEARGDAVAAGVLTKKRYRVAGF